MGIVDRKNAIDVVENNIYGDDISVIRINGIPFKGISRDSLLGWDEFVWSEEPTRNNTFAFENMDDIDVGLVAQCKVDFKYFNIHDFMRFREAIKQRYFRCTFFNVDTGEWEYDREMYCSKSDRQKLYYFNPKLLGVLDFSISLVATNRDKIPQPACKITYNNSGYNIDVPREDIIVEYGEQYTVDSPPSPQGFKFLYWTDKRDILSDGSPIGWHYKAGQSFTVFKNTTLYAVCEEV